VRLNPGISGLENFRDPGIRESRDPGIAIPIADGIYCDMLVTTFLIVVQNINFVSGVIITTKIHHDMISISQSCHHYPTPDYRMLKTEPASSTQQAGRRETDHLSSTLLLMTLGFQELLLLMTLGFQEPTTAITPTCVGAWVRKCCGAGHP